VLNGAVERVQVSLETMKEIRGQLGGKEAEMKIRLSVIADEYKTFDIATIKLVVQTASWAGDIKTELKTIGDYITIWKTHQNVKVDQAVTSIVKSLIKISKACKIHAPKMQEQVNALQSIQVLQTNTSLSLVLK
jgi:hypothetical protein